MSVSFSSFFQIHLWKGHKAEVLCVAHVPFVECYVSSGNDCCIRFWDVRHLGELVREISRAHPERLCDWVNLLVSGVRNVCVWVYIDWVYVAGGIPAQPLPVWQWMQISSSQGPRTTPSGFGIPSAESWSKFWPDTQPRSQSCILWKNRDCWPPAQPMGVFFFGTIPRKL